MIKEELIEHIKYTANKLSSTMDEKECLILLDKLDVMIENQMNFLKENLVFGAIKSLIKKELKKDTQE